MSQQLVILGTSVTLPDPGSVTALAADFQQQGGQLADLESNLQSLTRPDAWGEWTGLAADTFGQSIGQLPAELGVVADAYEDVASALQQYAGQLEPVVSSLSSLSYQAEDAEGALAAIQNARSQAIANGQDPAATGWDARVADASDAISALQGQLYRLLGELTALAAACTKKISAAEPKRSGKSLLGELERDFVRDVAGPLARDAKDLGKFEVEAALLGLFGPAGMIMGADPQLITGLWHEAIDHAEELGQVLGEVAGVLGILALIPGIDAVAGPAAVIVGAAAAAADWVAVANHEKGASVLEASLATVGVALSSVGMVAKAGAEVADLDNGADAAKAGENLWVAGAQRAFTPSGIADQIADENASYGEVSFGQKLVNNVAEQYGIPSGDPPNSPAAVTMTQVELTANQLNYLTSTIQDRVDNNTESLVP